MARRRRRLNGTGSIYQRKDGRWAGDVPVPGAATGKRSKRLTFYGQSPAEVEQKMAEALMRLRRGYVPLSGRMTVGRHLDDWLEAMRPAVRPATWISYEGHVRIHLAGIHHIPLLRLAPADVRRLMSQLIADDLSATTARNALTVLRMALKQAVNDGLVERNVASLVAPPRIDRDEIRPLTLEQARMLMVAAQDERLEALYVLTLSLGLRMGEALGLRWSHLDLEQNSVRIAAALRPIPKSFRTKGESRLQLVDPKTRSGRRVLPLPGVAADALRAHRRRQLEERLAAGARWKGNELELVFTTPIGTPLDQRNVTREWKAVLEKAGLPPMRYHDLRHSAASLMLASGMDLRIISEVLGHSVPAMSALYAHVMPKLKTDLAAVVDAALTVEREAK